MSLRLQAQPSPAAPGWILHAALSASGKEAVGVAQHDVAGDVDLRGEGARERASWVVVTLPAGWASAPFYYLVVVGKFEGLHFKVERGLFGRVDMKGLVLHAPGRESRFKHDPDFMFSKHCLVSDNQ